MTKRHFEALAREIATIEDRAARLEAANAVARACLAFNPNFYLDRFLRACNAKEG